MSSVVNLPIGLHPLRELRQKRVVIVGVGKVGKSAARLGIHLGAEVVLLDDRPPEEVYATCADELKNLEVHNDWDEFEFRKEDIVALSPGVPRRRKGVQRAIQAGATLVHELELAAAQLSLRCVLGITGTNGKSTTTALLGNILKGAFDKAATSPADEIVFVGGNLGPTLCDAFVDGQRPQILALELSSYQLETMLHLEFDAMGVTNFAPDHLDRYENVEEYYAAKLNLKRLCSGPCFANGLDTPLMSRLGDMDSWEVLSGKSGKRVDAVGNEIRLFLDDKSNNSSQEASFSAKSDVLVGPHNLENTLLAAALAEVAQVTHSDICKGIESFKGIAHRLEYLGSIHGVRFFNDSKATNVDAAATAVRSFEKGVRLIVGGKGKGGGYDALLEASKGKVVSVHCIGEEGKALKRHFLEAGFAPFLEQDLISAFSHASKLAVSGETILLAPACASFDQFKNFEVRGDAFRELFLAKKRGDTT